MVKVREPALHDGGGVNHDDAGRVHVVDGANPDVIGEGGVEGQGVAGIVVLAQQQVERLLGGLRDGVGESGHSHGVGLRGDSGGSAHGRRGP